MTVMVAELRAIAKSSLSPGRLPYRQLMKLEATSKTENGEKINSDQINHPGSKLTILDVVKVSLTVKCLVMPTPASNTAEAVPPGSVT